MAQKYLLEASNLSVAYGDILILDKVSLHVCENEIVGLVGVNGAGKSTLLHTIAGLKEARNGEIIFRGKNITRLPPRARSRLGIAYIPQENNIFPKMSVKHNLDVALRLFEKKERKRKLDYIFELFPVLKEREKQVAGSLSGGEQRMLALALGLCANSSILLVDEPSIGLAPKVISEVFDVIKSIKSNTNLSVLIAEQNVKVLEISDRIYGLEAKSIKFEKKVEELDENLIKKLYLGGI